jgi:polyhydroxyalkanoate synthesis regulator phasin
MATPGVIQRLLDAGMQFTELSQSKAEKLVGDLVKTGAVRRKDVESTVHSLLDRSRSATEQLVATVQAEVGKQVSRFAERMDNAEDRIEELASKVIPGRGGKQAPAKRAATATKSVASKAVAATAPAKKSATRRSAATKTPAKKTPAVQQAPAKKTTAAKAPAKKTAAATAPAKKVAAKKAPAKRAAAKKAPAAAVGATAPAAG